MKIGIRVERFGGKWAFKKRTNVRIFSKKWQRGLEKAGEYVIIGAVHGAEDLRWLVLLSYRGAVRECALVWASGVTLILGWRTSAGWFYYLIEEPRGSAHWCGRAGRL